MRLYYVTDLAGASADDIVDIPCPGYNEDTEEDCPGDGVTQYLSPGEETGQHWVVCSGCGYIFEADQP